MATFAYGRVSTKEQTADNQRLEIDATGHAVDYWFADTISGKTSASQRPQFAALLDKIRVGETLIVSKLDRLGRDAQDVGATVKLLAARRISVIVLQQGKFVSSRADALPCRDVLNRRQQQIRRAVLSTQYATHDMVRQTILAHAVQCFMGAEPRTN